MLIGYVRVSTLDQKLDAQEDLLRAAGCEKIITDKVSGMATDRLGINEIKKFLALEKRGLLAARLARPFTKRPD